MKRSERLNKMLIYLSEKSEFNLKELMQQFQISKSTALRDIAALEEIGLPLYSSLGKNGRYHIVSNKLRYSINFSNDEIYALYFALLTLQHYKSTPFHVDAEHLKHKFELSVSSQTKEKLVRLSQYLHFEGTTHFNESPLLQQIVMYAIEEQPVTISYIGKYKLKEIDVQIVSILSRFGQWYVQVFDFGSEGFRVYRCDKITAINSKKHVEPLPRKEIQQRLNEETNRGKLKFKVEIDERGIDLFHKESYPSMTLKSHQEHYYIEGYYSQNETPFVVKYLLNYGSSIISISPVQLKQELISYIDSLKSHFSSLKI
ncbi:putative DNA-binding transcriptional regulator YafY [Paenibacillus turicensis]|uniref:DNA-binding transcriptional regulator YafY n=1 Tax=Paenibacillus turicensis TaxID=160487 RepID=A0ABS4FYW8_9BACL|nr:WYL domain-containing protein [Paenibacillus turicensis]MBP1907679.1 putative DNA-binding transcriptional regulator YafY [Paenibacillus turicensis]